MSMYPNIKTLRQIAEEWSTIANGGSMMMPTKVDWQATEYDINSARDYVLNQIYSNQVMSIPRPVRINDQWTLAANAKPSTVQPNELGLTYCYYTYDFFPTVSLNAQTDGILSLSGLTQVGSSDGSIDPIRVAGFEQWRNIVRRGGGRPKIYTYWWYQDGKINVTKKVSAVKVRFIPASPYQVKTYNFDTKTYSYLLDDDSPYPISGEVLELMKDHWLKSKGILLAQGVKDTTDNGNINTTQNGRI
mgnify:CR=1 FL=1